MSDVKRWEPENTILGYNMRPGPEGSFVLAADFDALRTEFETFKADRLKPSEEILEASAAHSKKVDALQDLLNDRDERLDEAKSLVSNLLGACDNGGIATPAVIRERLDAFLTQPEAKDNAHP